jgi:hypothetical protein
VLKEESPVPGPPPLDSRLAHVATTRARPSRAVLKRYEEIRSNKNNGTPSLLQTEPEPLESELSDYDMDIENGDDPDFFPDDLETIIGAPQRTRNSKGRSTSNERPAGKDGGRKSRQKR